MKNNKKLMLYIPTFELCFKKSPHPAYQILKPVVPYIKSVWGCIRGAGCVLRDFLSFSDLRYHFDKKGP
tara:strand:+ start:59 stop:265 length:207 start_codon:yes stop_codon:yes gene_type:complete